MVKALEFEGKTTEEALEKAAQETGVPLSELKFEIISAGGGGIFGLSLRKAKIRVFPEEAQAEARPAEEAKTPPVKTETNQAEEGAAEPGPPRSTWARPSREVSLPAKPKKKPTIEDILTKRLPKGKVDLDLSGRQEQAEPAKAEKPASRRARRSRGRGKSAGEPKPKPVPEVELAPLPEAQTSQYPDDPAHLEMAKQILERLVEPFTGQPKVEASWREGKIYLEVAGDGSGLLIGRKGQTLEAIQYLASKMLDKLTGKHLRLVVDAEGYRQRRTEALRQTAQELANKVLKSGKAAMTNPLNPHDRRIIHLSLQRDSRLQTRSRGEGTYKKVVILPKGQDEEEAKEG